MNPRRSIITLLFFATFCGCEDKRRYVINAPPPDADRVAVIRAGASGGGSEASPESKIEPTGWGTIRGTIRLSGPPPVNPPYNVTGNFEVCSPGGTPPLQETYVVGGNNSLADVVVFLKTDLSSKDEEKWIHESARPGRTEEVLFDQHNCVFDTHVLALQTSQPMKIMNSDSVGHNTLLASDISGNNYNLGALQSIVTRFNGQESKPFKVSCSMHPWMYAWVIARDNGYFCVTDESGTFEIPNLPAGVPLSISFWHEAADINSGSVEGAQFRRSQLSITLDPDSIHTWDIVVPAP